MRTKRAYEFGTYLPIKINKLQEFINDKQSKMLIYLIISMLLLVEVSEMCTAEGILLNLGSFLLSKYNTSWKLVFFISLFLIRLTSNLFQWKMYILRR